MAPALGGSGVPLSTGAIEAEPAGLTQVLSVMPLSAASAVKLIGTEPAVPAGITGMISGRTVWFPPLHRVARPKHGSDCP